MSCSASTSVGSSALGTNERSSPSRTATIFAALSASGAAGSRPLTLLALIAARTPFPAWPSPPPVLPEGQQPPVQVALLGLGQRLRQPRVACRLLGPQLLG